MAFARYGYSVGATTSPCVGSELRGPLVPRLLVGAGPGPLPNRGAEELRSAVLLLAGKPPTGEEVSKPPNWAEVYICGGTLEETEVSGRPLP